MDRRRFHPSAEGLEGRAMLSLFGGSNTSTAKNNSLVSTQDLPETFVQKEVRIERLPFYFRQTEPNRFLPADTIGSLQNDLRAIEGDLHDPGKTVANWFDTELRHVYPYNSLSRQNAAILSHAFGAVLSHAGATPQQTANLQNDMNQLAKVDSESPNPTLLVSEDYALTLQAALGVGRPLRQPTPAALATNDGQRAKDGKSGVTTDHTPAFVGSYQAGANKDGFTSVQLVTPNGEVLGAGTVDLNGRYTVRVATPLPDGVYQIGTRAADIFGHVSAQSPHDFTLKVVTGPSRRPVLVSQTALQTLTPPGGPLAVSKTP